MLWSDYSTPGQLQPSTRQHVSGGFGYDRWASGATIDHFTSCNASPWMATNAEFETPHDVLTGRSSTFDLFSTFHDEFRHLLDVVQQEQLTAIKLQEMELSTKCQRNDGDGIARWICETSSIHTQLWIPCLFTWLFPESSHECFHSGDIMHFVKDGQL